MTADKKNILKKDDVDGGDARAGVGGRGVPLFIYCSFKNHNYLRTVSLWSLRQIVLLYLFSPVTNHLCAVVSVSHCAEE